MSIFTFTPTSGEKIADLKVKYRATATAPLDGMWEAFTGMAEQFSIGGCKDSSGFCAVNDEQKMLQFFALPPANAPAAFRQAMTELKVTGAVVSTAEPAFLALCMDHQKSVSEHAIMYHMADDTDYDSAQFPGGMTLRLMNATDLQKAVGFAAKTIGADTGWLEHYFGGLITRGELYGLFDDDALVSTGECRPSSTQPAFADVGMIVSTDHRGKGIATNVLRCLIEETKSRGLEPICSTECTNIPAQKAITKAGFTAYHRILEITF